MKLVLSGYRSSDSGLERSAAQQARVADAAARPRDRGHFGIWFRLHSHLDLLGGAANAQHVGRRSVSPDLAFAKTAAILYPRL